MSWNKIYENTDGNGNVFQIYEGENIKNYNGIVDETKDKVYYLYAPKSYRYFEKDLEKLYELIIKNKQLPNAKLTIAMNGIINIYKCFPEKYKRIMYGFIFETLNRSRGIE